MTIGRLTISPFYHNIYNRIIAVFKHVKRPGTCHEGGAVQVDFDVFRNALRRETGSSACPVFIDEKWYCNNFNIAMYASILTLFSWINMKLSVVVCTFNRSESLRRMLNSLREAVIPDNLSCELIVVDNNSDDDTRLVFKEIEKHYESIIRYVFEDKRGISHARNRGIREAKGEIIAFTDDDVIVDKHWIQNIYKAFKEHDDVACVGGKILPIWGIPKPKWLKSKLCMYYLALLDHGDSVAYMDVPDIWGANFAIKAEMFKKYGLFDPNLGRMPRKLYSGEETEFLQRLQKAGEKILYYPLSIINHNVPAHRMSKKYIRKWRFDQGELEGIFWRDTRYLNIMDIHNHTTGKMLRNIIVSLLKIGCFTKDSFDHELRICHILGFLLARMKRMHIRS